MITDVKIVSAGAECSLDWGTPETRTTAEYAVTPMDLVLFGHSPARWRLRPGRDPEDGPGRHELLRGTLLAAWFILGVTLRYAWGPSDWPKEQRQD